MIFYVAYSAEARQDLRDILDVMRKELKEIIREENEKAQKE